MNDAIAVMTVASAKKAIIFGVPKTVAVVEFAGISDWAGFEAAFPPPPKPAGPAPYPYDWFVREVVCLPREPVARKAYGGIHFDTYNKTFNLYLYAQDADVSDVPPGTEIGLVQRFWTHWGCGARLLT